MVTFFVGLEAGPEYVAQSIPYALAGLSATLSFSYAYYQISLLKNLDKPMLCAIGGLIVLFIISSGIRELTLSLYEGLGLFVIAIGISIFLLRKVENVLVTQSIRLTPLIIAGRTIATVIFVISAITIAESFEPQWSGLMIGFPMTLLPTLFIIHRTYSARHTHTIIRNLPRGMGAMITYALSVYYLFPQVGVVWGTITSIAIAYSYLFLFFLLSQKIKI